jgi:hypothetical protein
VNEDVHLIQDKITKWNKIPQITWITLVILSSVDLISTAGETMILPTIPDIINEFNITFLIHLEY